MSQLLIRLESELKSMAEPVKRAEWTARIAANLARVGSFDEAHLRISSLRQTYGDGRSGPVSAWIMLAEGLVHLYKDLSPAALDRIARAHLLGTAMGYTPFVGVAAAWKAHVEFEMSKFTDMLISLKAALKNAAPDEHDAQTRIAMVLSNCFMLCGEFDRAQNWFLRGREHAVKNGDQASVEALLYNRAVFRLAWIRLRHCEVEADPAQLQRARAEIKSSRNLQDLTQISALTNHIHLADARLLILERKYDDAISELQAVRNRAPFANHNFTQAFIELEICFCHFCLGKVEQALLTFCELDASKFLALDLDEQVVAEWMRWRMAVNDPRFGSAAVHRERYEDIKERHDDFSRQLRESLDQLTTD